MAFERERIEKIVLIAVLVCGGAVCAWMFYLSPKIESIAGGKDRIVELDEEYREAQNVIKRADRSKKTLEELKLKLEIHEREMSPELLDEWILNKVNTMSRQLDAPYDDLKPEATVEFSDKGMAQSYCLKKWKLNMKCDYHTLGKFLNGLENASPFINIDDLVIMNTGSPGRQKDGGEDRQVVNFTVHYVARKVQD